MIYQRGWPQMKILKIVDIDQSKEYERLSKMQEKAEQMWKDGLMDYDDMMETWFNLDRQVIKILRDVSDKEIKKNQKEDINMILISVIITMIFLAGLANYFK
jgi:hypothetical protein